MLEKISFLRKISVTFMGLLLAIAALEGGLRLGDAVFSAAQEYKSRQLVKKGGTYRILCLGESTTKRQYPSFLEKILNQKNMGIQFSVIDKGQAGVRTETILSQLEANLDQYKPQMVIAMMGCNDQGTLYYRGIFDANTWMFRYLRSYQFIRLLYEQVFNETRHKLKDNITGAATVNEGNRPVPAQENGAENVSPDASSGETAETWKKGELPFGGIRREIVNEISIGSLPEKFAYFPHGSTYRDKEKFSILEKLAERSIQQEPQDDGLYLQLGWLYADNLKFDEAERAFRKTLELNPRNAAAFLEIGRMEMKQKKFTEAESALKQAIQFNPGMPSGFIELGMLYHLQRKFSEAIPLFYKAITLEPEDDRLYGRLALTYAALGNHPLFLFYMEKANEIKNSRFDLVTLMNYRRLKTILDRRGIKLVCMQYPMRSLKPLRDFLEGVMGLRPIFVDNENIFKDAVRRDGYGTYFLDMFAGNFGHCTDKGNELLAENIANVIFKEVFAKS